MPWTPRAAAWALSWLLARVAGVRGLAWAGLAAVPARVAVLLPAAP
jgi:hypothetical protein